MAGQESGGLPVSDCERSEKEQVKGAMPVRRQVWEMGNSPLASDVHRSP